MGLGIVGNQKLSRIRGVINMINTQVPLEDITHIPEEYHRLFMFDPTEVYNRLYNYIPKFDRHVFSHFKRRNHIEMSVIFPDKSDKTCACGCGRELTGRRRRWFSDECSSFSFTVHQIISGDANTIRRVFREVFGKESCMHCGRTDNDIPRKSFNPENEPDFHKRNKLWNREIKEMANKIHVEHITPVHKGGGGCWLGNYQLLCEDCHKQKTKNDRSTK